jgi:hypothetical protein
MRFSTMQRCGKLAAVAVIAAVVCAAGSGASAALQTDPVTLYGLMQAASANGSAEGWPFDAVVRYETAVFDAGRAFALFKRDDPQYGEVAGNAVDVATQLHYDPLLNDDASLWYVREAAAWIKDHGDALRAAKAASLLDKIAAADGAPALLAQEAEGDARAAADDFKSDAASRAEIVVADVRAYNLTRDGGYRSLALLHASDPSIPLDRIPESERTEILAVAESALRSDQGFSETDRASAKVILAQPHVASSPVGHSSAKAIVDPERLKRTAPADEYFGRTHLSPLSAHNESVRINLYLDAGWGARMAPDALNLESSLDDWQRQYPHDPTLPPRLLDFYRLLLRIDAPETAVEAKKIRALLLIQYAGTLAARQLAAEAL